MVILRHKKTNVLYKHINGNEFKNIHSNVRGVVTDEVAKKIFEINVPATVIMNEYPMVEKLAAKLKLIIEKND